MIASTPDVDHREAIEDAVRYVLVDGDGLPATVSAWFDGRNAVVRHERDCLVADLGADGYRITDRNRS